MFHENAIKDDIIFNKMKQMYTIYKNFHNISKKQELFVVLLSIKPCFMYDYLGIKNVINFRNEEQ